MIGSNFVRGLGLCVAAGAIATGADAAFTGFVVTAVNVTNSGQALRVYTVVARFNGPTDTLLNAYNFGVTGGSTAAALGGFWHKDNASQNSGVLMQGFGTWSPSQTGSAVNNRPYDSYLTIGNQALGTNTSNADPSWPAAGGGWDRPDLAPGGTIGWFNSNPPNLQGRVGQNVNTATDVRIGQFVLSANDAVVRTYTLTVGFNDGTVGASAQFATATFSLSNPCPTYYRDFDGDGFGAASSGVLSSCTGQPAGYVANNLDCNDANAAINPNTIWFRDTDGDGRGFAADGTLTQCTQPAGYALIGGDNCPSIANADQADCNGNLVGDVCDIASGLSLDCDSDGRPDECEGAVRVAQASALLPISSTQFAEQVFTDLPRAYGRPPKLRIEATADLGAPNDGIVLTINGTTIGTFFSSGGSDCPAAPDLATVTFTLADFNAFLNGRALAVRATAFGVVNSATCPNGGIRFRLDYDGLPASSDCNGNGVLDSCELALGTAFDCNGNGVLDSCDIASGFATDCNGNTRPDSCDLASGASTDIDGNGRLDECSGEFVVGGSGFASIQAAINAAPTGATIKVAPGTHGPIDLSGKSVTVQSLGGAGVSFIDGGGTQRCVTMVQPGPGISTVQGFTIRNGSAADGAGVRAIGSALHLRNCILRNNTAVYSGGAVAATDSAMVISNCEFTDNSAQRGAGVFTQLISTFALVIVRDSTMTGNVASERGGGAMNLGRLFLQRVTLEHNSAGVEGGGLATGLGMSSELASCRFCINSPQNTSGSYDEIEPNIFSQDCNANGVCDADEFPVLAQFDCNTNGILDACDISAGTSQDCNANGIPDSCDIASGASGDVDSNGIPDDCKPDCDNDNLPDAWELLQGLDADCNGNNTIDRCEFAQVPALDCDGNLVLDSCEIAALASRDCNANGTLDRCEIAANPSLDKNSNGHLDDCELRRGDLNLDGVVGSSDLSIMLALWGFTNPPVGDLNGDGVVSAGDLAIILVKWGTTP
jgi:Right handed beta helix region